MLGFGLPEVVGVVPSFRPDDTDLVNLVRALRGQGIRVVVADDASPCTADNVLATCSAEGAEVVRHDTRRGIARSLNDGLRAAGEASWLLTVDQDSVVPAGYVSRLLEAAREAVDALGPHAVGAVGAAGIDDPTATLHYPTRQLSGLLVTEEVLQSGTLWSVPALRAIGGFDESLGIDAVDAAACVRLRASGRRIVLAPGVVLGHRVGDGRPVRLLGRTVLASGHSAERRTTIIRNRLRLAPEEFRQSPLHAFRTLRRVAVGTLLAVTVEDERWAKAKASVRGLLPARRGDG